MRKWICIPSKAAIWRPAVLAGDLRKAGRILVGIDLPTVE
jgi:hypothetical protein